MVTVFTAMTAVLDMSRNLRVSIEGSSGRGLYCQLVNQELGILDIIKL